jgi:hypothetical protein
MSLEEVGPPWVDEDGRFIDWAEIDSHSLSTYTTWET